MRVRRGVTCALGDRDLADRVDAVGHLAPREALRKDDPEDLELRDGRRWRRVLVAPDEGGTGPGRTGERHDDDHREDRPTSPDAAATRPVPPRRCQLSGVLFHAK